MGAGACVTCSVRGSKTADTQQHAHGALLLLRSCSAVLGLEDSLPAGERHGGLRPDASLQHARGAFQPVGLGRRWSRRATRQRLPHLSLTLTRVLPLLPTAVVRV